MSTSNKHKLFLAMALPENLVEYLQLNNLDVTIAKTVPCSREELLNSVKDCAAIFCTPGIYFLKNPGSHLSNSTFIYYN